MIDVGTIIGKKIEGKWMEDLKLMEMDIESYKKYGTFVLPIRDVLKQLSDKRKLFQETKEKGDYKKCSQIYDEISEIKNDNLTKSQGRSDADYKAIENKLNNTIKSKKNIIADKQKDIT
eukprot:UN14413